MNKQELLAELTGKFYKLGTVAPFELSVTDNIIREEEGIKWYMAGVYEKAGDRLMRKNIPFYVEKEGEVTEAAFYSEKDPVNSLSAEISTPFKELVKTEIDTKILDGTLLRGIVEAVNETEKFAIVTAYVLSALEVIKQKYFVYTDALNKLHFTKMQSV